jgi:hypothetical protein
MAVRLIGPDAENFFTGKARTMLKMGFIPPPFLEGCHFSTATRAEVPLSATGGIIDVDFVSVTIERSSTLYKGTHLEHNFKPNGYRMSAAIC